MRPQIIEFLRARGLDPLAAIVPTDGVLYGVILVTLVVLFVRRGRLVGFPHDRLLEAAVVAAGSALVGTRLYHLIESGHLWRFDVISWFNGSEATASWGVYFGGTIGIALYTHFAKLDAWKLWDVAASVAALGPAIGRLGCFLAGDDFGRMSDTAWAMSFPPGSLVSQAHASAGLIASANTASLPVHPYQLYLAVNGMAVFLIVSAIWRRHRERPGLTLAWFFVLYGLTRFAWGFLRDPAAGGANNFWLSNSQIMCVVLLVLGAEILLVRERRSLK